MEKEYEDTAVFLLIGVYGFILMAMLADFAYRYTPPAGDGVQGFNCFLFPMPIILLFWFFASNRYAILQKKPLHLPVRAIVLIFLYIVLSYFGTDGWSYAFMGVTVAYSVLLAMIFEVYLIPIRPERLRNMTDKQLKFYASNWRFAVQLLVTGSIAAGVGLFYKGITTDNFVPKHLIFLLGVPAVGVISSILHLSRKIWAVQDHI
ncbi:hypothetical protein M0R88_00775 [Halorussus gelatinilyticus]|uniref:Uncharacterized protein n=1 Tax=Halorussus gelatinilyticus TaxID=2937524 RepID=A0A8U0IJ12_9EURY|nr:hypothetical protein [Halorussus gelatinilyticus]UPW00651.1 hypothetical protein M0R88_00775 [Halorussus gelatinilyticus]